MSTDWLVHDGKIVPDVIVLSHSEQLERLRTTCPDAIPRAVVAGDISYDRMRTSRILRASYRRAFGLSENQKLVVISSTWGPDSLLATAPSLPLRLAEALPADEFRILLAPHPNVAAEHSEWQLRQYIRPAIRAGVHISDDVDSWRAAIVSADLTVGDHSSVGFYSTALGNPLLLASAPEHAVDPRSPVARLLRTAPLLDQRADLEAQVRAAITDHDPFHYTPITALTTSEPDASAAILRSTMYRLMNLREPSEPAEISALPIPRERLNEPNSHLILAEIGAGNIARIVRYPAERLRTDNDTPRGSHLAVGVHEPQRHWLDLADVIIGARGPDTEHWIHHTLARLPGCALAAAPTGDEHWLVGDNSARILSMTGSDLACRLFSSVAYHRVTSGAALNSLGGRWTIGCGGRDHRVEVTPVQR